MLHGVQHNGGNHSAEADRKDNGYEMDVSVKFAHSDNGGAREEGCGEAKNDRERSIGLGRRREESGEPHKEGTEKGEEEGEWLAWRERLCGEKVGEKR